MALSFSDITTETLARLRLDSNSTTLANGWVNQTIQDLHSRHDWFWTLDRAIVQTFVDKPAGTVSVSASGTSVNGSSTEFDSGDIGSFIQFQDSNDWYKITAVGSAESLTIEIGYNGTSGLSAGTYTIRKIFYTISNARKILSATQAQTYRKLTCLHY